MNKQFFSLALLTLLLVSPSTMLPAQTPAPAPPQAQPIALVGGTAHLGNGQVIENAVVSFDKGKITAVGNLDAVRIDRNRYQVIDTSGKHIYPGFILAGTQLGLTEVSSVRATVDTRETGTYNPNVRALIAYNTDSELIPTMRFNGILTAQVTPAGGTIPGTSSIVGLDAWNWQDAAIVADDGIHLNWPSRMRRQFDFATFTAEWKENKEYPKTIANLEKLFSDATGYSAIQDRPAKNLKLAAMQGLFDGSRTLFIDSNDPKGIVEAVTFGKKHGVKKMAVFSAYDLVHVIDFIKQEQIPIIIKGIHSLPPWSDAPIDAPFRLPAILAEHGVLFAISYPGVMNARNLPFIAGTAVAHGLDREAALKALTGDAAKILGIDDRLGTLETGKHATLFVSEGDALDMRTNNLVHAFIDGRQFEMEAMQQRLYNKYKTKYGGR